MFIGRSFKLLFCFAYSKTNAGQHIYALVFIVCVENNVHFMIDKHLLFLAMIT